ncbi:MAG TPA: protein kinase [Candidatus Hydrogenedentes bacterium]|nr:protein kinase [Candidatus Hydrogenedentota bacterium]
MDMHRNILLGLLLEKRNLAGENLLSSAGGRWYRNPDRDLGRLLVDVGALSGDDLHQIGKEMEAIIAQQGGDVRAAIKSLGGPAAVARVFGGTIPMDDACNIGSTHAPASDTTGSSSTIDLSEQFQRDTVPIAKDTDDDPLAGGTLQPMPLTVGPASRATATDVPAVKEHPGRYKSIRTFAAGGMGKLFLVHDLHLNRDIILKELLPEHLEGVGTRPGTRTVDMLTVPVVARFMQEARITSQLEHPAIVPVYELGYRDDGSLYYTMKYVRGRTLQDVLNETRTLSDRLNLLTRFLDLCQAIAYAHSRNVIHRDIKPLNVMVGEFGETVVIDWGIAKVLGKEDIHAKDIAMASTALQSGDTASLTKTVYGQAMGSPYFMAPEQAQGRVDKIDQRSDIYSLGAVLYTILSGRLPYLGLSANEFLKKVVNTPPVPIRQIQKDVPPELAAICERAMQRNPEDRYQTAKELADEIENYLSGGLVRAHTYRFSEHLMRFVKKHKTFLSTAAAGLVALVALGVFSYIRVVRERDRAELERQRAEINWQRAETEKKAAEEARGKEQIAREAAERELYFANISLSERCIQERRMDQARELLANCPDVHRNWEWGRLEYLCNADRMTLAQGGQFVRFTSNDAIATCSVDGHLVLSRLDTGQTVKVLADKGGYQMDIAVSAVEPRRLIAGIEGRVAVWDAATGEELFSFDDPRSDGENPRRAVAISTDGRWGAALNQDGLVRVWDLTAKKEAFTVKPVRASLALLAFTPSGAQLLVSSADMTDEGMAGQIEIWDTAKGETIQTAQLPAPLMVKSMTFSPNGAWVAIGTNGGLLVWDAAKWAQIHALKTTVGSPRAVAFSPDGGLLAAGNQTGELKVWETPSGKERFAVNAHLDFIGALAFTTDGGCVVTASSDRTAKTWDAANGRELETLRGHNGAIMDLSIADSGERLATTSYDGTTKIWDIGADRRLYDMTAAAYCAAKGQLAGAVGNEAILWDAQTGREIMHFAGHAAKIYQLAVSPDGARLATAAGETADGRHFDLIRVWDTASGKALHALEAKGQKVMQLRFDPLGARLAVRAGNVLQVWDMATGEERLSVPEALGFAFSDDGSLFCAGTSQGDVTVYDAAMKERFSVKTEAAFGVTLAFSPDSQSLIGSSDVLAGDSYEGHLHFWSAADGQPIRAIKAHKGHVAYIAYAPDGRVFATAGADKLAKVWEAESGNELLALSGHASEVASVAFTPNGQRIATASADGTFKLWERDTGREILTLQNAALHQKGEGASPGAIAFSPDSLQAATLTMPVALAPQVLRCFPWDIAQYPGNPEDKLQDRIEQYKRK